MCRFNTSQNFWTRHHDQGDERRLATEDFEGRHAAEPRDGVVGEDEVGRKVSQLAAEVRFGVDAAGAAGNLGPLQLPLHELRVDVAIVDEEDVERG